MEMLVIKSIFYIVGEAIYVTYIKKTDNRKIYYFVSMVFALVQFIIHISGNGGFWTIQSISFILTTNALSFLHNKYLYRKK